MKKTIRLTESDLHRVIRRAVYEATKGERGMSDKQKQRRRNANYIKDVNGSGDKYFHPNTYSDYEPSNVDRYERNAPFHGNDWFDDKVHTDRLKKHRSSQNHKEPDDFMESIVHESVKRVVNETELNYDVDNFSGRHYKNPPEEIDPTGYLDDPNNPPGSGEDWSDWDDFVEYEFGGDQKAAENAYSWGLHGNSGFLPDGNKGRMAYGYDVDSMIDSNNDSIDDEERVKTAMGRHEKKKWLNGAKDDEMFDFLHPGIYGESKLRNIVRESIKRVVNEELSDKVKRSMQMASDWIDVDNNNRMLTDFTPDMYSSNYRGNNNVYDLSNDVSPLGHKRHEEMNDAWDEHERNESKIRNIVRESIKRVINEEWYPENENDIDDYYYGAIFKFDTDLVYFDEGENIPEDLLNIKDEYIESQNTYTSVMVTNVEPEVDETDGSASFTITAAINAPNMPLDEIEEEVTNTVWVWLENKLNKRFTRVWIEGEEVVYDRRSVE